MAIRTQGDREARTIEGKPIEQWFDAAAQRQGRDNKFATYDAPHVPHPGMTRAEYDAKHPTTTPKPPAEPETKRENVGENEASEKAPVKSKPVTALQKAREPDIAAAKVATKTATAPKYSEVDKFDAKYAANEGRRTAENRIMKAKSALSAASSRSISDDRIAKAKGANEKRLSDLQALHHTPALDAAKSLAGGIKSKALKAGKWFHRHYVNNVAGNPPTKR
jgi:hypothetical protein